MSEVRSLARCRGGVWKRIRRAVVTTTCLVITLWGWLLFQSYHPWRNLLLLNCREIFTGPWRMISYAIPHTGLRHWLPYAFAIAIYGVMLEGCVGSLLTAAVVFAGIVAYGVCHLAMQDPYVSLMGRAESRQRWSVPGRPCFCGNVPVGTGGSKGSGRVLS